MNAIDPTPTLVPETLPNQERNGADGRSEGGAPAADWRRRDREGRMMFVSGGHDARGSFPIRWTDVFPPLCGHHGGGDMALTAAVPPATFTRGTEFGDISSPGRTLAKIVDGLLQAAGAYLLAALGENT